MTTTHNSDQIKTKAAGPNVDAGTYTAQLMNVEMDTGKYGPQRKLTFMISDGEFEGEPLSCWINDKGDGFSPSSNAYRLISALLGRDLNEFILDDSEPELQWDDLITKKLRLVVTEAKREDGTEFSKITDYLARQRKGALKETVKEMAEGMPSGNAGRRMAAPDEQPPLDADDN